MGEKNFGVKVYEAVESFLRDEEEGWSRHEWMQAHGEWASAEWDDAREGYTEAVELLASLVGDMPDAERADADGLDAISSAVEAVHTAVAELDGQVRPDESDYIAEGRIDPDEVADQAEDLEVGYSAQGWDCTEGWNAYRAGSALYMHWWRDACGNRHGRSLWVLVDDEFFAGDDDEEEQS